MIQETLYQKNDIVQVSSGFEWTMILKSDGKVYSIGDNSYGKLGIGSTIDSFQFLPISQYNSNITKISCQLRFGVALRNGNIIV